METKLKEIEDEISTNKVVLYMKGNKLSPRCGFSARVLEILNKSNIPFTVRDVLEDETLRQAIKIYSDWPTIPQLYVDKQFIGGCDIVTQLAESGELQDLLGGKNV